MFEFLLYHSKFKIFRSSGVSYKYRRHQNYCKNQQSQIES